MTAVKRFNDYAARVSERLMKCCRRLTAAAALESTKPNGFIRVRAGRFGLCLAKHYWVCRQ